MIEVSWSAKFIAGLGVKLIAKRDLDIKLNHEVTWGEEIWGWYIFLVVGGGS